MQRAGLRARIVPPVNTKRRAIPFSKCSLVSDAHIGSFEFLLSQARERDCEGVHRYKVELSESKRPNRMNLHRGDLCDPRHLLEKTARNDGARRVHFQAVNITATLEHHSGVNESHVLPGAWEGAEMRGSIFVTGGARVHPK